MIFRNKEEIRLTLCNWRQIIYSYIVENNNY